MSGSSISFENLPDPGVVMIPAGNPSEWTGPTGNNTYLMTGAVPALIDAGIGNSAHIEAIARALGGFDLAVVLITHHHRDHTAGLPRIRERWPGAVIRNLPPDECRDLEIIAAGDRTLRAIHTPGHAPDHFCFFDEHTGTMFCGDLARLGGTIVIPASTGGDLRAYLASLERVRSLAPRLLLPAHGAPIARPIELLDAYTAHRLERERQVLGALRSGCATIDRMVARIYGPLPAALVRAAADSVHAHLIKLADEGRAIDTTAGWRPQ